MAISHKGLTKYLLINILVAIFFGPALAFALAGGQPVYSNNQVTSDNRDCRSHENVVGSNNRANLVTSGQNKDAKGVRAQRETDNLLGHDQE